MGQLSKQFGKIKVEVPVPHLLNLQVDSYQKFLQEERPKEQRLPDEGLEGVFRSVFPIEDFNHTASLEFESYDIGEPKYDQAECISKGLTYEAPVRITVRLVVYDVDKETQNRTVREAKGQDIYFGTLPLMTEKGTFIINGTERVIVNQLQRSPGILFEHDAGKTHTSHTILYSCRVIPMRGSWLDFDFDHKDILYVRIDRRRKMPVTILLKAMGMTKTEILDTFYKKEVYYLEPDNKVSWKFDKDIYRKEPAYSDVIDSDGKVIVKAGKQITKRTWRQIHEKKIEKLEVAPETPLGLFLAQDMIHADTGEVLAEASDEITVDLLQKCREQGITELTVLHTKGTDTSSSIRDTLVQDKTPNREKAQEEIYRRLRPSAPPTPEIATSFFENLFRTSEYYDLSAVGRYKINQRLTRSVDQERVDRALNFFKDKFLSFETFAHANGEWLAEDLNRAWKKRGKEFIKKDGTIDPEDAAKQLGYNNAKEMAVELITAAEPHTLTDNDILDAITVLVHLKDAHGPSDDIDHLGNRRVRLVGELVENQYRIGLVRMERAIKERMSIQEVGQLMPHDLINPKPVAAVLKEFFGTSQLSQFMDQTNSLSEVTHKRRLSALGPGGLTRERAGFEVRDVHVSHYGRICPIETPEGPNIGLIVSLTTYAKVNDFGFIETPYRKVKDGQLTNEFVSLDASSEGGEVIAQADAAVDKATNTLKDDYVPVRAHGDVSMEPKADVTLMDISPSQMVSISAATIPFLEHDDANRALMGSNMQRQAVPLLRTERPLVGTGMELNIARDSGQCILAEGDGVIHYADADRIIVCYDDTSLKSKLGGITAYGVCTYNLMKYRKSNQNSCFGQVPCCHPGQIVKKGDVLADGPAIHEGGLALGKNMMIAFMPWCGYNYEDSVLISERVVKEDIYTSIHIEEFEVSARDTKLGPEEITRDIPNVGEDMLRNLDDSGIIRIGAAVKPDDILVGKITPKGETQLTPEEKLLRAIFGDKARDVKNSSLKVPPGIEGTIIEVKVFNRRSGDKDDRTHEIEDYEIERLNSKEQDHVSGLTRTIRKKILEIAEGKQLAKTLYDSKSKVLAEAGAPLTQKILNALPLKKLQSASGSVEEGENSVIEVDAFKSKETNEGVAEILELYKHQLEYIRSIYDAKREKATEGDDLPPGVIKMVKVYVAMKRKLSVGDKMAGRHGNKGVVSRILPEEDMPFFADGRPVDIVLNPMGVPSRMNIGQIMEVHLGWAARELGRQLAEMVDKTMLPPNTTDVFQLTGHDLLQKVREEVKDIFDSKEISAEVDAMDDDEFRKSVLRLRDGIITYTPVFDGAQESEIWKWLQRAGLPDDGKSILYDGRTGEAFQNRVTTGVMYFLKLHHLVDEKIHARSTGPYSLVTQQPLGGKAQFGGQRLGEMEVWALEAYGASYLLQEFLTVKSDDVNGRVKMYEKIVKGDNFLEAGLPESFNVLVKELMSLGLNVSLHQEDGKKKLKQSKRFVTED